MPTTKKLLTGLSIKAFFLFGGIEYVWYSSFIPNWPPARRSQLFESCSHCSRCILAVILPTLLDYLQLEFGADKFFYGLTLSAFSMANLLTGPLYGLAFDRTHQTKLIILFGNLFEIGGNFLYFAAQSKYMVLASRFCVGIGAGAGAAIFGELSRTTTKKERTTAFSIVIAVRQFGLIIGPGLNLFLRKLNYEFGPFTLNKYTAPGALMTIVWLILELMFLFLFFQLPPVNDFVKSQYEQHVDHTQQQAANTNSTDHSVVEKSITSGDVNVNSEEQSYNDKGTTAEQEKAPLLVNDSMKNVSRYSTSQFVAQSVQKSPEDREKDSVLEPKGFLLKAYWLLSEFIRQELVCLLAVFFVALFNQTSIETMVVPMFEDLLGWNEFETSLFFCGAGVDLIIGFAVLMLLTKKIADRWLLLFGLILELLGYIWFIVFVAGATKETPWIHAKVLSGSVVAIFGLPFLFVVNGSLFSKLLPKHVQGFGQGLRRSTGSVAAILGPLWAGATLHLYHVMLGVPLGILVGVMVITLDSFSRLREPDHRN